MRCHTANILVNRKGIIVQNNDDRLIADGSITEAFVGHATGCGAVTNERNNMMILLLERSGMSHTQSNGNRAGCMTRNKGICTTF